MADELYSTRRMLVLRKLTRAIADLLRAQVKDYLSTLAAMFRPASALAGFLQMPGKEPAPGADRAFKDLQTLYEGLAGKKPFHLLGELKQPLEVASSVVELAPVEYVYVAKDESSSKIVTVTSPLKWVLTYAGFAPRRLKELFADKDQGGKNLQQAVLHYLMLHVVVSRQGGVTRLLEGLHFPVSSERWPDFGDLPIPCIGSPITTLRPPDAVIIESTEISGMDAFEEVINLDDIVQLRDPLQKRLLELAQQHGADLLPKGTTADSP
jgi:hypothetical protein